VLDQFSSGELRLFQDWLRDVLLCQGNSGSSGYDISSGYVNLPQVRSG